MQRSKIWMNGRLVPFEKANVHVLTHALHYSTAIFEGLRCYDTVSGPAIFRLSEHMDRFFNSARLYSMRMRFSKEEMTRAVLKTVSASGLRECYVRPIAYYGAGTMGLTPTPNKVDVAVACWEWKMGESKAGRVSGARCKVSSWLKIDSRSQPTRAKAASNYANAALARMEALDAGYDEAILLNYHGKVSEASAENIFIVRGDNITTPPLISGLLEGITRDSVMQIIAQDGGHVRESDIDRDDLYSADEIFMTGTAAEVKSVTQVDGVKIGGGKKGPVTRRLQKAFMDAATGRDERFASWLTHI